MKYVREIDLSSALIPLVLAFAIPIASSAQNLDTTTLCWRDHPIPTEGVVYEKVLASQTIAPDRITIDRKTIKVGMSESGIAEVLGSTFSIIEDWAQRTERGQCEYLLEVLRKNPNSMHLYGLANLKL